MAFTEDEIEILLIALKAKRELIVSELEDIDALIEKTQNSVVSDNSVFKDNDRRRRRRDSENKVALFKKIELILQLSTEALSSREILQEIYKEYPEEYNENEDRKHIAAVSSVLYAKVSEKQVEQIKKDREQTKFKLIDGDIDSQLDKLRDGFFKQEKKVILDEDDDELPF